MIDLIVMIIASMFMGVVAAMFLFFIFLVLFSPGFWLLLVVVSVFYWLSEKSES